MDTTSLPAYASRWAAAGYDALSSMVFAPLGGLASLRAAALDELSLVPGLSVLELGCGTGGFTRLLAAAGVRVTAVDGSASMLRRARRRAPAASFVEHELTTYRPDPGVDRVLCAFVLHELDPDGRRLVLSRARAALVPDGEVVIVEHALPERGLIARAVSRFVHAFEPPTVIAWLRGGFTGELASAGLAIVARRPLARGAAVVLRCRAAFRAVSDSPAPAG